MPKDAQVKSKPQLFFLRYLISDNDEEDIAHDITVVNGLIFCSIPKITSSCLPEVLVPIAGLKRNGALEPYTSFFPLVQEIIPILQAITDEHDCSTFLNEFKNSVFFPRLKLDPDPSTQEMIEFLANHLGKFRSLECMIISMKLAPEAWKSNHLLEKFMEHVLDNNPEYAFYDTLEPNDQLTPYDPEIFSSAGQINARLQVLTHQPILYSLAAPISRKAETTFLGLGLLAGISGGLLLGNVLNLGLLAGVGGVILAGLTTAAAATGFGLIAISAVMLGIGLYCLYKNNHKNDGLAITHFEQDEARRPAKAFLNRNVPEKLSSRQISPDHSHSSSFFRHPVNALRDLFDCSNNVRTQP